MSIHYTYVVDGVTCEGYERIRSEDAFMAFARSIRPGWRAKALALPLIALIKLLGIRKDVARRNNMLWKDGWIVQQPGPKNSLGLVKFDMQNEHAIYLHDTPAKQLFDEVQRQRSHGCVRVEDALGFAEMLARDAGILDEWHKARATGKESFVSLPRPIPVRLYYQTVLFDADGAPVIRADPYGWNDRVSAALGFPARKTAQLRSSTSEVGP